MVCQFEVNEREIHVDVDLSSAELPIVGLTEGPYVNNSQYRPFGTLTDSQRMNEYLSWYMNGTTYRAEDNFLTSSENYPTKDEDLESEEGKQKAIEDTKEVINYSGPLKKMLPFEIQKIERLEEIERTLKTDLTDDGINEGSIANGPRHDQIVACTYSIDASFLAKAIGFVFGGGADLLNNIPGPCYPENEGVTGDIELWGVKLGSIGVKINRHRLSDFYDENKLPPLRQAYENFANYWIDYKKWRGNICTPVIDLGVKLYLCFDETVAGGFDKANPNYWGNIYNYIPFSSTEDRVGNISMQDAKTQPSSDLRNQTVKFEPDDENGTNSKNLFFPHMQETAELGVLIQSTYVSGTDTELKNKWLVGPNFIPQNLRSPGYNTNFCEPLESRSPNPGDNLFGNYPENPSLTGDIVYSGEFTCIFPRQETTGGSGADYTCSTPGAVACRLQPEPASDYCHEFTCGDDGFWHESGGDATGLSLYTNTPNIEELWERYVNGEMSTFKRIYPKVGEGRPVTNIKDIPADTKISYSSTATETNAGNPNKNRPGSNASLYIPHLGSIYDYFLKGIQKALRPKDAGIAISTIGVDTKTELAACYDERVYENYTRSTEMDSLNILLRNALGRASSAYSVPGCVLTAILSTEGSRMRVATPEQALILTSVWDYEDPMDVFTKQFGLSQEEADLLYERAYCAPNSAGASGPMQITNFAWDAHSNAAIANRALPSTHIPNRCNFTDAVFAAAEMIDAKLRGKDPWVPGYGYTGEWDNAEPYCYTGEGYYGSCRMDSATCRLGTNYCDYIRKYCGIEGQDAII